MQYLKTISGRVCLVCWLALGSIGISGFNLDPTDDFGFSFMNGSAATAYKLMSEEAITDILSNRLDIFPRSQTAKLAHHLLALCKKYRFDPAFVLSMIQVESGFRVRAVSPAGAVGLMQLMPETAELIADRFQIRYNGERSLADPFTNVSIGVAYLSFLRAKYASLSPYFHVAAYNIGPAKLDELRARKSFTPDKTKKYYNAIRRGVPAWRFFKGNQVRFSRKGITGV